MRLFWVYLQLFDRGFGSSKEFILHALPHSKLFLCFRKSSLSRSAFKSFRACVHCEFCRYENTWVWFSPNIRILPGFLPAYNIAIFERLSVQDSDRLTHISRDAFSSLPQLVSIDFSYNQIRSFPTSLKEQLPRLNVLRAHANPLNCDCRFWRKKILSWSQSKKRWIRENFKFYKV